MPARPRQCVLYFSIQEKHAAETRFQQAPLISPSAHVIASIASQISWRKLWDLALDRGVKGTYAVQGLLRELSRPLFGNRHCRVCKEQISIDHDFIKHLNDYHPELLCHLSVDDIISGVCSTLFSHIFIRTSVMQN